MVRRRLNRTALALGGVIAFVGLLVTALPTCGCMPPEYKEIPLSKLPPQVVEEALLKRPGSTPTRAWTVHYEKQFSGYLVRVRISLLKYEDINISNHFNWTTQELEPIGPPVQSLTPPRPMPAAGR